MMSPSFEEEDEEEVTAKGLTSSEYLDSPPQAPFSMHLPPTTFINKTQTVYVSRHLRSCNNLINDLKLSTLRKFADPGLPLWGILTGLALQRPILGEFNNVVYVSCLVRTWMTAIIEFLPHCEDKTITLQVSPYIKEKHHPFFKYLDLGNFPLALQEQFSKLEQFFDLLLIVQKVLSDDGYSRNNRIPIIDTTIMQNLGKILTNVTINFIFYLRDGPTAVVAYFDKRKLTVHYDFEKHNLKPYETVEPRESSFTLQDGATSNPVNQSGGFYIRAEVKTYILNVLHALILQDPLNENEGKNTKKLEDVDFHLNPPLEIHESKISEKRGYLFNRSKPTISPYVDYFGKEGLWLFINWVNTVVKDESSSIYVVSHSHIMQQTLVDICQRMKRKNVLDKRTLKYCHPTLEKIQKQNIWELILTLNYPADEKNMLLTKVDVRAGADIPNDQSKKSILLKNELGCFKQNLKIGEAEKKLNKDPDKLEEYYKKKCPKKGFFFENSSDDCKDLKQIIDDKRKNEREQLKNQRIQSNRFKAEQKASTKRFQLTSNRDVHTLHEEDEETRHPLKRKGGDKTKRVRKNKRLSTRKNILKTHTRRSRHSNRKGITCRR